MRSIMELIGQDNFDQIVAHAAEATLPLKAKDVAVLALATCQAQWTVIGKLCQLLMVTQGLEVDPTCKAWWDAGEGERVMVAEGGTVGEALPRNTGG